MMRLVFACVLLHIGLPAHAQDPFGIAIPPQFGLGAPYPADDGVPLVEQLGWPGTVRTQSRAIELLGNEFSRAAAQGLIDAQEVPSQTTGTAISNNLDDRSNLSVVTGIDRDTSISSNVPPTAAGAVCLSDAQVDLASWGDAKDSSLLGKLRTDAIAENGDVTSKGALKLARFYLSQGFGSEAKALAKLAKSPFDQDIINALADILDTGKSNSSVLRGQISCEGSVALWAALAQPISATNIPNDTNAILTAFSGLPPHLRAHLGPMLAGRFRDMGLDAQARNVLNAVLRGGSNTEESTLADAKLGLSGTRPNQARQKLVSLSNGTGITAAEALLVLLEDAYHNQVIADAAWVEDVPSLVRATEGTEVSAKLNISGIRGMIGLKRFDAIRLILNEEGPGLNENTRAKLAAETLAEAIENASDEELIRGVIGLTKFFDKKALSRDKRFSLAKRLSGLGLAKSAIVFLPAGSVTEDERRIASGVLAGIGDEATAIALIEEQPTGLLPELADLHAQEGNIDRALQAFSEAGDDDAATLLAIQSGNWNWVAENGSDAASESAQALLDPLEFEMAAPINGALILNAQTRRLEAARLLGSLESE